jgi:hypothetical protein
VARDSIAATAGTWGAVTAPSPDVLPVVLRPSRRSKLKALLVGASWAFFAGVGITLLVGAGASTGAGTRFVGGVLAASTAPLSLYWLLQLVPGASRLEVTPTGIVVRHAFRTRTRRWEEVRRFYTRLYRGHRIPDWTGVAFEPVQPKPAGLGALAEDMLRIRGIFDTDLLPDTYGLSAEELRTFLNVCDVRWSGEKLGTAPKAIPVTTPYVVVVALAVGAFGVMCALFAWGSAADRNWGSTAFWAVCAAAILFGFVKATRRRERFMLSSKQR